MVLLGSGDAWQKYPLPQLPRIYKPIVGCEAANILFQTMQVAGCHHAWQPQIMSTLYVIIQEWVVVRMRGVRSVYVCDPGVVNLL